MKKIDLGLLELDIHDCPIGVSLSGGADSSILLYLLMKHATSPIHIVTCGNMAKFNINVHHSVNVIEKCIELTGNYNIKQHVYYVKEKTRDTWLHGMMEFVNNKTVDMMYTGFTSNPPVEVTDKFILPMPADTGPRRGPDTKRESYPHPSVYTPFTNLDKQGICKLYENEKLLKKLFPLTHSCEDPSFKTGHCGKCWWCEERKWGFGYI